MNTRWFFFCCDESVSMKNWKHAQKLNWMQKFEPIPGAVYNFVCYLFANMVFIYNNTLGFCLCFKAKGHGTRMTSEEQSLKWWGFLQDEMRFTLFYVISRTLFYQDYIYMYIILTKCSRFNVDIYPITLGEFSVTHNIYN